MLDKTAQQEQDRRTSNRFAIEREIRYRVVNKKGQQEGGLGKTVNMSSTGILFSTERPIVPGRTLEIAVSWPAQLNNSCALKFCARGRVVRADNGMAAIHIQHYEFRTLGSQGLTLAS